MRPNLAYLPDVIHDAIGSYLSGRCRAAAAGACKALLQPYSGRCKRVHVGLRGDDGGNDTALRRFLGWQEALVGFSISSPSLLPAAVASSSGGAGRRLRRLFLTGYTCDGRAWEGVCSPP